MKSMALYPENKFIELGFKFRPMLLGSHLEPILLENT